MTREVGSATAMPVPLLSVIIVAWRSRDEIGACVRSIPTEIDGGAVEVVVVDNSLDVDGTALAVAQAAPHVRYLLPPENLGFGRANNLGFRETTGEHVLFLNPDTVCNAAALLHCLRRLRGEPRIGMISPQLLLADGTMDLACRRAIPTAWDGFCRASGLAARFPRVKLFSGYNLTHLPAAGSYDVGAINGAFMLGRRAMFVRLAEPAPHAVFDERFFMYGDDLDLCIRVTKAGFRVVYDGRVSITHLKGLSVAKDYARMAEAIFEASCAVYLKHFNPRGSRLVAWRYRFTFGLWKRFALARARWRGSRSVRPC
jgi:GT2 family glycosyltransferase